MKRKDFLKISASAAMFFGISPKNIASPVDNLDYLNNNYTNDGSCIDLTHEPISNVKCKLLPLSVVAPAVIGDVGLPSPYM